MQPGAEPIEMVIINNKSYICAKRGGQPYHKIVRPINTDNGPPQCPSGYQACNALSFAKNTTCVPKGSPLSGVKGDTIPLECPINYIAFSTPSTRDKFAKSLYLVRNRKKLIEFNKTGPGRPIISTKISAG